MKHTSQRAIIAGAIELKGDDEDPVAIVTKSLDDLTKTVGDRLDALEKKGEPKLDEKTLARLTALENKTARVNLGGGEVDLDKKAKTEAETKAFGTYLRHGDKGGEELKALTVSNDPQGGYLAPDEMNSEFIRNLVLVSPIRSIASIRSTTASAVKYPKRTAITNAAWEGETDDQPESTVTFGQADIPIRMMTTYVDISNQLLSDSAGQAEAEVNLALSQDFGAKEGLSFVSGDGVIAPEGFLTNADVAYTANGGTSSIDPDALLSLMYSLPAPYRSVGTWVCNGTTLGLIRQIKDDQGRYIWQPGLAAGQPETIFGKNVVEAVDMPDASSGNYPIAFGDFSTAYRIVDRIALSILVNPYIQATKGITRIHATRRVGGGVLVPTAIRKLKYSAS